MQPHKSHLSHSVKSWYSSIQCASTAAPFNVTNEWSLFGGGASSWAEDPFLTPFPVDFRDKRAARERGINDFFCELMICLIQMDYSHTHTLVRTFLGLDRFASIPLRRVFFIDQHTTMDQGWSYPGSQRSTIVQQFCMLVLGSMVSHSHVPVQPPWIECNQKAGSSAIHTKLAMMGWAESIQSTMSDKSLSKFQPYRS